MFQNGFIFNEKYQLIKKISENELVTFWNVEDIIENEKLILAITKSKSVSITPGFGSNMTLIFKEIEIKNLDFNTLEELNYFILPNFENENLQSKIDKNELFSKEILIVKLINQCAKSADQLQKVQEKNNNLYIPSNIFIDSNYDFFFVNLDSYNSKIKNSIANLVYEAVNGIKVPSNDVSFLKPTLKIDLNLFYLEILNNKLINSEIISKTDYFLENGFWEKHKQNIENKKKLATPIIIISIIFIILFFIINGGNKKSQNYEIPKEIEEEVVLEPVLNPEIEKSDYQNLKIIKVEFTNKYTIVSYVYEVEEDEFAEENDSTWIRVDKSTIISEIDSQKKYKLLKTENINIDEKLYYNKNTKFLFYKLYFEKVDNDIKYVDIIEEKCKENCFNFYGIKITNDPN